MENVQDLLKRKISFGRLVNTMAVLVYGGGIDYADAELILGCFARKAGQNTIDELLNISIALLEQSYG